MGGLFKAHRRHRRRQPLKMETKTRSKTLGTYEKKTTNKATKSPTTFDIVWAAGIFEGEGSSRYSCGTTHVTVPQKDPWILYRFQEFFGGHISQRKTNNIHTWSISGTRARGFLMTIYSFMSPRRKEQIKAALYPPVEKQYKPKIHRRRRFIPTSPAETDIVQCQ